MQAVWSGDLLAAIGFYGVMTNTVSQRPHEISLRIQYARKALFAESKDLTGDGIFTSKNALTDDGYVVEVVLRFKTLRFQSGKEMTGDVNLHRGIPRKVERV